MRFTSYIISSKKLVRIIYDIILTVNSKYRSQYCYKTASNGLSGWCIWYFEFRILNFVFRILHRVSRILYGPSGLSYDSPCHTFPYSASWCIFPCVHPLCKTYFTLTYINKCTECFMIFTIGLIIPNSHLSRNVVQCNPRRKHMCTNSQRQYKLLHSYMDHWCIRWSLQEQYHI